MFPWKKTVTLPLAGKNPQPHHPDLCTALEMLLQLSQEQGCSEPKHMQPTGACSAACKGGDRVTPCPELVVPMALVSPREAAVKSLQLSASLPLRPILLGPGCPLPAGRWCLHCGRRWTPARCLDWSEPSSSCPGFQIAPPGTRWTSWLSPALGGHSLQPGAPSPGPWPGHPARLSLQTGRGGTVTMGQGAPVTCCWSTQVAKASGPGHWELAQEIWVQLPQCPCAPGLG